MNNKSLSSLLFLISIAIFFSCSKIILPTGAHLLQIDEQIYEQLARNKEQIQRIGLLNTGRFNTSDLQEDDDFKATKTYYEKAQKNHNNLVEEITKTIRSAPANTPTEFLTFEPSFANVSEDVKMLSDHSNQVNDGVMSAPIPPEIISASITLIKQIAAKAATKLYLDTFKKEFKVADMSALKQK